MKKYIREILFFYGLAVTFFLAKLSGGQELAGVSMPDQIKVNGAELRLNGLGLRQRTIFNIDVYVAGLYLRQNSNDENKIIHSEDPRRIDLVFLRDVAGKDIVASWREGFEKNCPSNCGRFDQPLGKLNSLMLDVKKGQEVSFTFYKDHLALNAPGREPAKIEGREFTEMVLETFIGKEPPTEKLKKGLLGISPR